MPFLRATYLLIISRGTWSACKISNYAEHASIMTSADYLWLYWVVGTIAVAIPGWMNVLAPNAFTALGDLITFGKASRPHHQLHPIARALQVPKR